MHQIRAEFYEAILLSSHHFRNFFYDVKLEIKDWLFFYFRNFLLDSEYLLLNFINLVQTHWKY